MYIRLLYVLSDCSGQQKVSAKVRTKVFSVNDSIFLFNDHVEDDSIKNNIKNDSKNNIKNDSKNNTANDIKNNLMNNVKIRIIVRITIKIKFMES